MVFPDWAKVADTLGNAVAISVELTANLFAFV